jgi:hypothetical protein
MHSIRNYFLAYPPESAADFAFRFQEHVMIVAANEQAEAPSPGGGKAPWKTPRFQRLDVGEAQGGDSIAGDNGAQS